MSEVINFKEKFSKFSEIRRVFCRAERYRT